MPSDDFWQHLDRLVNECPPIIDRPAGSAHPRYPEFIYPHDYGYLSGTCAVDGGGIDVWRGSGDPTRVTAVICCVDLVKHDAELKLLLGCLPSEAGEIVAIHNGGGQSAIMLRRPPEREVT